MLQSTSPMRRVHVAFVLALGCASASKSVPGWEESPPAGEEMAANDPVAAQAEPAEAKPAGDDAAASETAPPSGTTGSETEPAAPTEPATPLEPDPTAPPAKDPLPKPLHAKIDGSCGKGPGVGQRLKSFSLKTTKGKSVSSGSLKGKVAVVNFWGTWCKPCLKELPEFDQLHRRYRKHGMTLVAIATDTDPAPVDEFVGKHHLSAKVLIGGEDYANGFSPDKFPFTFVVDPKGIIRASYRGYRPECIGKLEADVRKELEDRG